MKGLVKYPLHCISPLKVWSDQQQRTLWFFKWKIAVQNVVVLYTVTPPCFVQQFVLSCIRELCSWPPIFNWLFQIKDEIIDPTCGIFLFSSIFENYENNVCFSNCLCLRVFYPKLRILSFFIKKKLGKNWQCP